MTREEKYVELWQLCKEYPAPGGGIHVVVEDFALNVKKGEFVCIIGHSGCGKSTVLSMLAGLNEPTSGTMILAGREVTGPGLDRGIVFQSPHLLPWLTALENVKLAVSQARPNATSREHEKTARHYLSLVGLGNDADKRPQELSGGMRQRVGLARAFSLRPKLLLLDEPFGMLDSLTRFELQAILLELWTRERQTAIMVTHDVDEALFLSDRVVMMTTGPRARVGELLEVPFARPRDRQALLDSSEYYVYRERMIAFLEEQAHPAEDAA